MSDHPRDHFRDQLTDDIQQHINALSEILGISPQDVESASREDLVTKLETAKKSAEHRHHIDGLATLRQTFVNAVATTTAESLRGLLKGSGVVAADVLKALQHLLKDI